ncbi:L-threonylcarbamoyladenylate synthase [Candidatus Phytoplasma phoenicium]|uniref:L-threonylcarbamoyladenylate synthase n=1 Tax=Candidatus Phytoplasma phoenicium TaxID=198422 RepID=UPI000A690356|nr:L-threonylcarbamoyladenylate synthase [Candidatus Phytoplasma phoenicium]
MLKHKIIIFPTDTVYGIGTTIDDQESLNKIFKIKNRSFDKAITILFYSLTQMQDIVILNSQLRTIIDFFWPGPLTLIVSTKPKYYQKTNEKKIGIRIPNHQLALKILKIKGPMRTTSVNQSGQPALNDPLQILKQYQRKVDYVYIDVKFVATATLPSTVIDTTFTPWKMIREGKINLEQINRILSKINLECCF